MATTIITKYGSGAPTASDVVRGELAVDTENKRLYTEDSGGSVVELGTNPAANVTFGDSVKAIFGAGSDLQIYHDGSNSYIDDAGANRLYIRGSRITFDKYTGETMVDLVPDGAVNLFYDNSNVFQTTSTGINVTGTVTADGLTLGSEGDQISIPTSNGSINGIITTGDAIYGNAFEFKNGNAIVLVSDTNDSGTSGTDATLIARGSGVTRTALFDANGDVSLFEDTGITAKLFWDASAESLGIGTTSPDTSLHISEDSTATATVRLEQTDTTLVADQAVGVIEFEQNDAAGAGVPAKFGAFAENANAAVGLRFYTGTGATANERMRIDKNGNVHIGTATGTVAHSNLTLGVMSSGNSTSAYDDFRGIHVNNENATAGSGLFGGGISFGRFGSTSDDTSAAIVPVQTTADEDQMGLAFFTHNTNTRANPLIEAMRIDASGNVGIGNTVPTGKLTISEASGANAPTTVTAANTYLQLGSADFGASNNGKFMIGFGFTDGTTNTNAPAYLGFEESSTSGDTKGSLTFYTRDVITDTAPSERMRIDSSGNVGIGDTSPSTYGKLVVAGSTPFAVIRSSDVTTAGFSMLVNSGSNGVGSIATDDGGHMTFDTGSTGAGQAERMRIDSSGNLLVGASTFSFVGSNDCVQISGTEGRINIENDTASTAYAVAFYNTNGLVGKITTNSSSTNYDTSSDQRLKENIVDAPSASDDIDAIQVRSFDWKVDGSHQKYGMVAQELVNVAPSAVSQPEDPEEMMGVDYSKLVPMLIKEIQQLRARVAQLEGAN